MAPAFHTLRLSRVRRDTDDAVALTFDVPPDLASAYAFRPGQFLTLRAMIEGQDIRRSYSICSGPNEPLTVGIKRIEGGVFSTWANQALRAGDTLSVMTPDGRFGVPGLGLLTPSAAYQPAQTASGRTIAAFAAGSGITPILSVVKTVLASEPETRVFLFQGNRSTSQILFRDVIEELKDRYLTRLSVFHVLSREQQDIPVLNGRLDADKVRLLLRTMLPAKAIDHALVCGPNAMIDQLPPTLRALGISPDCVHVERFTPSGAVAVVTPPPATAPPAATDMQAASRITVIHDGASVAFPAYADETIIDAAMRAGRDLPWSCKGGMCCTCRARVREGEVAMVVNYSLEPWEIAAGFVLTCQARPLTPTVVVDYDAA